MIDENVKIAEATEIIAKIVMVLVEVLPPRITSGMVPFDPPGSIRARLHITLLLMNFQSANEISPLISQLQPAC